DRLPSFPTRRSSDLKRGGSVLADTQVKGRPSVNDLATLLSQAMRRPLMEGAHRPRRLHVRGHPQWEELFPHLEEQGRQVVDRWPDRKSTRLNSSHVG